MDKFPETRISLILRLAHPQDVFAWQEFVDIYAPAVYALALRHGLQPADAEDLTQETLFGVARAIGRFQPDRNRARFRTWLARITRNLIADHFSGKKKRLLSQSLSDSWLADCEQEVPSETACEFDVELQRSVFQFAASRIQSRVKPHTWEAFELTVVRGQPDEQVAVRLGMSVGNLYVARCRVMKMLRDEVSRLNIDADASHDAGRVTSKSSEAAL